MPSPICQNLRSAPQKQPSRRSPSRALGVGPLQRVLVQKVRLGRRDRLGAPFERGLGRRHLELSAREQHGSPDRWDGSTDRISQSPIRTTYLEVRSEIHLRAWFDDPIGRETLTAIAVDCGSRLASNQHRHQEDRNEDRLQPTRVAHPWTGDEGDPTTMRLANSVIFSGPSEFEYRSDPR